MNFDFFMPTQLITGEGCIKKNADKLAQLGRHCLIVTSGTAAKKSGALQDVIDALTKENIDYTIHDTIEQNPLLTDAHQAGETAKAAGADFVFGIGGGSPQDAAKAIAVFAANDLEPEELYDLNWPNPALPIVVAGTTAGTGSEVTMFAILTRTDGTKKSIAHAQCYPKIAFGDAGYTSTLPVSFTISTALDALSHAVEGYFSLAANSFTDLFAMDAIRVLYETLSKLEKDNADPASITLKQREDLYYASISAGMTLAHTGTCYCHSLGYFLSEDHGVPHGVACALFLVDFIQDQRNVLPEKSDRLWKSMGHSGDELIELVESLLPSVDVTLTEEDIDEIVARYDGSGNFARTPPEGMSTARAKEIMTRMFGKD